MLELSDSQVTVNVCTFEAFFQQAKVNLRFPSLFFIQWKSMNSKNSEAMIGRKRAVNSVVNLDESLTFTTEMIYHKQQQKYLKKDTLIHLNLISNSRPDQIKLVGRVVLDLSNAANNQEGQELKTYQLMYCSVEADIRFKIKLTKVIESNLNLNELDKSSFSDMYSFTAGKNEKKGRFDFKDNISEKKVDSQKRKIKLKLNQNEQIYSKTGLPPKPSTSLQNDKILIKENLQEGQLMLNSMPASEKNRRERQTTKFEISQQHKEMLGESFHKQKDLLEKELGQHKNRIKKLENDIAAAMKMFEQSEQKSQINRSKLLDSENALTQLANRENRIKEQHQKHIQKIKEQYQNNIELIKSGYEADLKLLQATLEEEKLRSKTIEHNDKDSEQQLIQAKQKILQLRQEIDSKTILKEEIAILKQQNDNLRKELQKKNVELNVIKTQLAAKESEYLQSSSARLKPFQNKIEELQTELENQKMNNEEDKKKAQQAITELEIQLTKQTYLCQNKIIQVKNKYDSKMEELLKELSVYQSQNQRLLKLTKRNMINVQQIEKQQTFKKYQQLQQNRKKYQELDVLRQSRASENNSISKVKQEKEQLQAEYFLLNENYKLQQMELKQLKEERQTLTNTIEQLKVAIKAPLNPQVKDKSNENCQQAKELKTLKQQLQKQINKNTELSEKIGKLEDEIISHSLQANQLKMYIRSSKKETQNDKEPHNASSILSYKNSNQQGENGSPNNVLKIVIDQPNESSSSLVQQVDIKTQPIRVANEDQTVQNNLAEATPVMKNYEQGQKPIHVSMNEGYVLQQLLIQQNKEGILTVQENAVEEQNTMQNNEIHQKVIEKQQQGKSVQNINKQFSFEQKLNFNKQLEERHHFNFENIGQNLTPEQINNIIINNSQNTRQQQQNNALRQENFRLKQELEQLREKKRFQSQNNQHDYKVAQQTLVLNEEIIKKIQTEKQTLIEQIKDLKLQLSQLIKTDKTVLLFEGGNNKNLDNEINSKAFKIQDLSKILNEKQQTNCFLQAKIKELQQQLTIIESKNIQPNEDFKNSIRDMEEKISQLQEDIKIKDQILNENERRMEESYRLKFQLADLKQKCLQLQVALKERDLMINDLEDTKEFLVKQIQQLQVNTIENKKDHFQINLQKVQQINEPIQKVNNSPHVQHEINDLISEIELLNNQIIKRNNQNMELRSKCEYLSNKLIELQKQKDSKTQENNLNEEIKIFESANQTNKGLNTKIAEIQFFSNSINDLNKQLQKYKEINAELHLKLSETEQINNQQKAQLQILSKNIISQDIVSLKNKEEHKSNLQGLPFLQIHTVESADEGSPLNYSHDVIPFDSGFKQDADSIEQKQKKQLKKLQNQIASLKFDLSQEIQQKQNIKKKHEILKNKIIQQQQQIQHLKEHQEKIGGLPLQSFDDRTPIRPRFQEHFVKDQQHGQPSIVEALVGGQATITKQKQSFQETPNKKMMETNTRFDTYISQQQFHQIKHTVQIIKEELESQKKIHSQLIQLHKICGKKYELLQIRYQNCTEQLDFYQAENKDLIRSKKQIQNQAYDLRSLLAELKEPKIQNMEIVRVIQNQLQTKQQKQIQSEGKEQSRNGQIITANDIDLKNKIETLEQNILTLEKQLQQQISTNQQYLKLSEKINRLQELQFMAEQCKAEMEEMKRQNEVITAEKGELTKLIENHALWEQQRAELQRKLTEVDSKVSQNEIKFAHEKQQLENKLHALQQQKIIRERHQSDQTYKNHLQNEKRLEDTPKQFEQRFQKCQDYFQINQEKKQVIKVPIDSYPEQEKNRNNYLHREMELIQKMAQVNEEKLKNLQRVAELEQKINLIQSDHEIKVVQFQETIITKNNEIQQLKFVVQQLERDIMQHKNTLMSLQQKKQVQEKIRDYKEQNNNLLGQLQAAKSQLTKYSQKVNELQMNIIQLRNKIKSLEKQQRSNYKAQQIENEDIKSSENIKDNAVIYNQLEASRKYVQEKLKVVSQQLQINLIKLNEKDKQISILNDEKLRTDQKNSQLNLQLKRLTAQLSYISTKYYQIEKQKDQLNSLSNEKDKSVLKLRQQISQKDKEIEDTQSRFKQKQIQMLKIYKECEAINLSNQKRDNKIRQLVEKQRNLKETIQIIQAQSYKIMQALKDRAVSEQQYYAKYIEKERQCTQLSATVIQINENILNKNRLLEFDQLKLQKLQSELQMFKAAGGQPQPPIGTTVDYDKYQQLMNNNDLLMNKNRQYLQLLSAKSTIAVQNQRLKNQLKKISETLSQITLKYDQYKRQQQIVIIELKQKIKNIVQSKQADSVKFYTLIQQITDERETKYLSQQLFYDNIINEKNKEINLLNNKRNGDPVKNDVKQEKIDSSQINGLNQQIMILNNEILEKQSYILQLKKQIELMATKTNQNNKMNKEHVEALEEQIINLRTVLKQSDQIDNEIEFQIRGVDNMKKIINELHQLCQQIKNNFEQRGKSEDNLFTTFIQRYDQIEQRFLDLHIQTSEIQEKARFISKQLQKIKANIIKSQSKDMKQKQDLLALIKPCEHAVKQLVCLSQTLSEKQIDTFS